MKKYKKGDKIVLHPPGSLDPAHNPLMGKKARIVSDAQKTDELEWYSVRLNSGTLIPAPAKWFRDMPDDNNDDDEF